MNIFAPSKSVTVSPVSGCGISPSSMSVICVCCITMLAKIVAIGSFC